MHAELFDWITEGFTAEERSNFAEAMLSAAPSARLQRTTRHGRMLLAGVDHDDLLHEATELLVVVSTVTRGAEAAEVALAAA